MYGFGEPQEKDGALCPLWSALRFLFVLLVSDCERTADPQVCSPFPVLCVRPVPKEEVCFVERRRRSLVVDEMGACARGHPETGYPERVRKPDIRNALRKVAGRLCG